MIVKPNDGIWCSLRRSASFFYSTHLTRGCLLSQDTWCHWHRQKFALFSIKAMQVFFCVSRYAPALIFANHWKKKTPKLSALSDLLRGIPPQSFSCPHRYRRLHSMIYQYNPGTCIGIRRYLGQSVVEQHFQHTKICKEAQFSEKKKKKKKERREKRLTGVDRMTGLLLIVLIEEDCRALPRRRTVFFQLTVQESALCRGIWRTSNSTRPLWACLRNCPCACQIAHSFLTDLLSPVSFSSSLPHWKTGKEVFRGFNWPPSGPLTAPSSAFTERFS